MKTLEQYKIITLTHREAKVHQIGRYVLDQVDTDELLQARLQLIKEQFNFEEMMYLTTCNRVLYFFVTDAKIDDQFVASFFSSIRPDIDFADIDFAQHNARVFEGREAIQHLFEVSASIDSLVVGEREILRQLREAYEKAQQLGLTGDHIRVAMRVAVEAAKEVYSHTRIGEKPVSIVSLAVQSLLALKPNKSAKILMVGAGQTNLLVSKFLKKHGFTNFTVFNRSLDKALQLALALEGKAFALDQLPSFKEGFDILIVCTGATQAVITPSLYEQLLNGDTNHKTVIDLSIPNNVDREVTHQYPMTYIEVEGLRLLARENLDFRMLEVNKAKQLLEVQVDTFAEEFKARQVTLALSGVPTQIKAIREKAITEVFAADLAHLDDDARELVERMMLYMEKKCISIPMKVAKEAFA
jgi:glutamyl-tRNA reductase